MNEPTMINTLKNLSDVLTSGQSKTVKNKDVGTISVDKGKLGKGGYGLLHIIENRSIKDNLNKDEITATILKVIDAVQNGEVTSEKIKGNERIGVEKDGIIAIISKIRDGKDEKFVISGYALNEKKEEATEAIKTVIANYGYTPEFSFFRKQVGAVVSSLQVSPLLNKKSSEIELARKAGYVQGVCECVAAIGDDRRLGKKLLTEMNVTKDIAKKYANPETYKALEQGVFAPQQNFEQNHSRKL